MNKQRTLILALLLAVGFAVAALAVAASRKQPEPLRGCTIVFLHREQGLVTSVAVRFISADGRWKETRTYLPLSASSRPAHEVLASDQSGVFQVHTDAAATLGHSPGSAGVEASLQAYNSIAFLRSSPQFRRDGEVVGFKTYVWQVSKPDADGYYEEVEFSAELGSLPLRSTTRSSDGAVLEEEAAVSIIAGDPPERVVSGPSSDMPIDFSTLDKKIDEEQRKGMDVSPLRKLKRALTK